MNTERGVETTRLAVATAALVALAGILGPGVFAAPTPPADPGTTPPQPAEPTPADPAAPKPSEQRDTLEPPPSPADAMAAFALVQEWVKAMQVPDAPPAGPALPGGVCVTLRVDHAVAGVGTDSAAGGLARATASAIRDVLAANPIPNDALRDENTATLAKRVSISLELAGAPIPIRPRTYADADLELAPGIDGVSVRVAGTTRSVFPSFARRQNLLPGDALGIAFASAGSDPSLGLRAAADSQPGEAGPRLGAQFYRFRVTHLSQAEPGRPPIFLFRGGAVVDQKSLTMDAMREWSADLAAYLLAWRGAWRTDEPPPGTYWPCLDKRDPPHAAAREVAVVAYALQKFAGTEGMHPRRAIAAADAAAALREALLDAKLLPQKSPDDPAALAFAALAALEAPRGDLPAAKLRDACAESLRTFYVPGTGWTDEAPPPLRGLIAFALVELARRSNPDVRAERLAAAEAALRSVYTQTPPGQLVSHLPWLGWAEVALHERRKGPLPAGEALRALRTKTWEFQVRPEDAEPDTADFVGGIVFPGAASPIPGATSARVLAFFATMLGHSSLTDPAETPRELMRVHAGMRFLRQLTARPDSMHEVTKPTLAFGGVRMSPWDQRQPPEATAVTLLAVLETTGAYPAAGDRMKEALPVKK